MSPRATIVKEFTFESAHLLPHTPQGHKCRRLHGHSFRCEVHVAGAIDPTTGSVCDFADLTKAFLPIHATLDHQYLNDVKGLENPTSENIARYIWEALAPELSGLSQIVIHETCAARCFYAGE